MAGISPKSAAASSKVVQSDKYFPNRWRIKIHDTMRDGGKTFSERSVYLLSEQAEFFKSFAEARRHLSSCGRFGKKALAAFDKLALASGRKRASKYQDWAEDVDLPHGWKKRCRHGKSNLVSYLSPQGDYFNSLKDMLKHLLREKSNKKLVEKLKPKLIQEGGYQTSALLPKGWMARQRPNADQLDVEFLTIKMQSLKGLERALDWLKMSKFKKKDDIINLGRFAKKIQQDVNVRKHTWVKDESLPEGWKMRTVSFGNVNWKREYFLTERQKVSNGLFFFDFRF